MKFCKYIPFFRFFFGEDSFDGTSMSVCNQQNEINERSKTTKEFPMWCMLDKKTELPETDLETVSSRKKEYYESIEIPSFIKEQYGLRADQGYEIVEFWINSLCFKMKYSEDGHTYLIQPHMDKKDQLNEITDMGIDEWHSNWGLYKIKSNYFTYIALRVYDLSRRKEELFLYNLDNFNEAYGYVYVDLPEKENKDRYVVFEHQKNSTIFFDKNTNKICHFKEGIEIEERRNALLSETKKIKTILSIDEKVRKVRDNVPLFG